jgi:hypothetical protein
MQNLPIYLYANQFDVILDLDTGVQGVNRIMYQRDLNIQKGIKNQVRIQFKNSDQKKISVSNTATYVFSLFDAVNRRLLIEKPLTVLDDSQNISTSATQSDIGTVLSFSDTSMLSIGQTVTGYGIAANTAIVGITTTTVTLNRSTVVPVSSATSLTVCTPGLKGIGELVLNESDTMDLDISEYQFTVKYQDPVDGTYRPAYANTYYAVAGQLKVLQDIYPVLQPSQEVVSFNSSFNADSNLYEHKSGNIYAYPEFNSNVGLHTVAMYMNAYRGTVYIQGTLDNSPSRFGRYATIATRTYNGYTGVDYANFNGVYTYVRIMYVPAVAPAESTNNNPTFFGSFDKVLYRC